jgi:hypothetical protein
MAVALAPDVAQQVGSVHQVSNLAQLTEAVDGLFMPG